MSKEKISQIGRYKVLDEIGHGGFGTVYRAYDSSVGRQVAIKVLTAGGQDVSARFRNEAQVAGNLRHENIVTVYEYGEHEGQPFLAMEYLEGEDLQHILASGRQLSLLQKCDIMSQVAEGLYCAHRNGVVHRDVKPANIMVLPDGRVKIMDFGIARITQDRDATRLTQEGWVVGTLLYMAPEQFGGGEVDALCDIFAYGVVYYELLTGRHPFQAPDSRTLMYKISFEDAPPVRDFVPQCPEALERVIQRILHKDRELRYQSLKDVQFDTEMVRMDLQTQRAGELVTEAQAQVQAEQLEAAQVLVTEALGLDPSNRVARSLREMLQRQLQQKALRPRIEGLIHAAEEHLANRRFNDAVQSFEAALKLDGDDAALKKRAAEARALLEHYRAAQNLVAEAQKELSRQNYSVAYQNASEALRHDAANPTAAELISKIKLEVENRQREKRIDEALARAEDLILSRSYDEAIALLSGLGADASATKVERLLAWLKKEKADRERAEKFQAEMAVVTDLLRARSLAQAVQRLEALRQDYPDESEAANLLAYARKEQEIEARARAVKELAAKAGALAEAKDFAGALALLEEGLKQYPGETTLIRMLGGTMAAKTVWDRQQAIARTVRECGRLRSQQRLAEAIEMVEGALREYSAEPELVSLLEQLEREWAGKRRADAVRKVAESAQQLLDRKQPQEAQQLLRQALIQYSGESRLQELLKQAEDELRAIGKARAIDTIVREANARAAAQDFARALAALDQGLETWAGEPALVSLRAQIASAQAAAARQKAIETCKERAAALAANQDFGGALAAVEQAMREHSAEGELAELQKRIVARWDEHKRREAVRSIASEARLLQSRGRLDEALELLNEGLAQYSKEAELEKLAAQVRDAIAARQKALAIAGMVRQSQELAGGHRFDEAVKVLEAGLGTYPGDPILARELQSIKTAKEKWDREQAVALAIAEAGRLAAEQHFDAALEMLARAPMATPELLDTRRRIERERDELRVREAVAKGAEEASALLRSDRPESALKLIEQLSTRFPGESQWGSLAAQAREAVALRKAAEERHRAVEEAVRECDRLARQDQFEEALERVAAALQKYSGEAALLDVRERLKNSWEERKRTLGIEKATADAGALLQAGKPDEAAALLRQANARYPGEVSLRTLLARADREAADRHERERATAECRGLVEQQKYQEAARNLERALARFPGDAELTALAARARAELDKRAREEGVAALAEEVAALSGARDFDRALLLLDRGLGSWAKEPRLLELQQSVKRDQAAWKREQSRLQAVQDVNQLARKERFKEARVKAENALKSFAGDAELLRLLQECRMREILADASAAGSRGKPDEGLRMMQERSAEYAQVPEWQALTDKLRQDQEALERKTAVRETAQEARTLAARLEFDAALNRLEARLRESPEDPALLDARRMVLEAQQAHLRKLAIKKAADECLRLAQSGKLAEAIAATAKALADYPGEASLVELRQRLEEQARTEQSRKQRAADLEQLRNVENQAAQAQVSARLAELRDLARRIEAQYPADEEIRGVAAQVNGHLADIENCRAALAQRNFDAALELCARYLKRFPQHAAFSALKKEAEQGRRTADLDEVRRRVEAETDLNKRAALLDQAQKRYPGEAWIAAELRIARNKLDMAESVVARARAHEAAGEWAQALEEWSNLPAIYESYPGLSAEIERVKAAQVQAAADALARWRGQIEPLIAQGQLQKARETLRRALSELPDAAPLRELDARLDELQRKQRRAGDLLNSMREWRKAGKWDQLDAGAREAIQLTAGDAASRKSVLDRLIECAQEVVASDWHRAEGWIELIRSVEPSYPVAKQLLKAVTDGRRAAAVDAALARAEELRAAKNLRAAFSHLAESLQEFPDEKRLKAAQAAIDAELQKARAAALRTLGEIRQASDRAASAAELEPLERRVAAVSAAADDAEVTAAAAETSRAIAARRKQLGRAHLLAQVAAHKKWIGIGAAAAVLAAGGAVVVPKWLAPAPIVNVTVASDVPGVLVMAGGAQCTTPQCTLTLRPGSYTLTAAKDGYAPVSQPLVLSPADRQAQVPLALQPLPEDLQVNTNFESGSVSVDGRAAGALRDGQFALSGVAPGKHTIRVTGSDSEFSAEWQSAPGTPPQLLGPVSARNLQAAIVANSGRTGTVSCNCAPGDVSLDGAPAGRTGEGIPAKLPPLEPGPRKIALSGRSVVVDIRPNPALNIFLSLDRNVGTLIINTGEDNARIFLNNRAYPRLTDHGGLRVPVNVGDYTIRAEKDGFHNPPAQTVAVAKGEEKQVTFTFTANQPVLEITGALPHVRVEIDRRPVGETDGNGGFRTEVTPGRHSIGLSKDGYSPVHIDEQFSSGKGPVRPTPGQLGMSKLPVGPLTSPVTPVDTEPQDWAKANNSGRIQDLQEYLQKHGNGAHARDAQDQIERLRQQAQQAEAQRAEQAAWDNLDKGNKAALTDFISRHPNSPHLQEARNDLDGIQRREAADAAARAAAAEKAARAADITAVQQTIGDYEAAFNRKDLGAMRQLYDPLPANLVTQFSDLKSLKSVSFELKPLEPPVIVQNSATVACTRNQTIKFTQEDRPRSISERVRVTLARQGTRWVIRDIAK